MSPSPSLNRDSRTHNWDVPLRFPCCPGILVDFPSHPRRPSLKEGRTGHTSGSQMSDQMPRFSKTLTMPDHPAGLFGQTSTWSQSSGEHFQWLLQFAGLYQGTPYSQLSRIFLIFPKCVALRIQGEVELTLVGATHHS